MRFSDYLSDWPETGQSMARYAKRVIRRYHRKTAKFAKRYYKRKYKKSFGRRKFSKKRGKRSFKQPNAVVIKHKVPCTIAEFIGAPLRDILPQLGALTISTSFGVNGISNVTQENKMSIASVTRDYLTFPSVDVCNQIFKADIYAAATPKFKAWNPYLDADLLGTLWDKYTGMYDYWRFGGVKVKWIPFVRTSGVVGKQISSLSMSVPDVSVTGTVGNATVATVASHTDSIIPTYDHDIDDIPYSAQLTMNMHVLFEKDDYKSFELPTDPSSMDETKTCKNTRLKYREFNKGPDKPNTYKVYNMNKPFSFFVKPYMQDSYSEVGTNDAQTGSTLVSDLNNQIKKRQRMGWLKYQGCYDKTIDQQTNALRYAAKIQDKNYFDPVLFSYFFTVNGISVTETLAPIEAAKAVDFSWNSYALRSSPVLSGMGRFQLTFYTHFKQLKVNQ